MCWDVWHRRSQDGTTESRFTEKPEAPSQPPIALASYCPKAKAMIERESADMPKYDDQTKSKGQDLRVRGRLVLGMFLALGRRAAGAFRLDCSLCFLYCCLCLFPRSFIQPGPSTAPVWEHPHQQHHSSHAHALRPTSTHFCSALNHQKRKHE